MLLIVGSGFDRMSGTDVSARAEVGGMPAALRGSAPVAEDEKSGAPVHGSTRRRLLVVALVALSGIAAAVALFRGQRGGAFPSGLVQVSGRVEGDSVIVASKLAGRVEELLAREGDTVSPGQILVRLDDEAARARVAQATAARDVAGARVGAARAELAVFRREVPLGIARAAADLEAADASLVRLNAVLSQAGRDRDRARTLRERSAATLQDVENAELAFDASTQAVAGARAARRASVQEVADARLGPARLEAKEAELSSLEAVSRQADAQLREAEAALADLTIRSPALGTVVTRFSNAGEVAAAGTPLLEIVDLDRLYLEVFVPELDVGRVHTGLDARIYTDAFPDDPVPAVVRYLSPRAEFTPKEVQTRDERTKLVYAARLYAVDNAARRLSPGLSADAVIRVRPDAPWSRPRW